MRKILFAIIILAIAIAIIVVWKSGKPVERNIKPEILNVTGSQATVAWLSKGKYKGSVSYMATNDAAPMEATESFGASDQHEVTLTGLRPSTRYTYWIGDSPDRYQFETQPTANNPFSLLITWGDVSDRIVSLLRSETGEFILSLSPAEQMKTDWFADVRPYVPVYDISGIDSPFLKKVGAPAQGGDLWKLDWGGLRLILVNNTFEPGQFEELLNAPSAHTIGIITSLAAINSQEPNKVSDINMPLQKTKLHSVLVNYNKQHPSAPAAFVGITGASANALDIDGVHYFGIKQTTAGAARVDIDVETARAVFIDDNREVALKQPPLKQKRTCEECRRLADKGAYVESVKAYLDFIDTHKGSFQIDDAYFAIADIYDSKLFEFKNALDWYRRLIKEYPDGTFTSLANQRIKYISAYSDYDYKPLTSFERIKAVEYARKKDLPQEREKIFANVKSLISQYPSSNLAPVMQHWLANQYRLSDPNKAVEAYLTLKKNYGGHPEAREAMVEIGETYYDAGLYKEAVNAYTQALSELPSMSDTIKAQISRSERNIRRDKIAYLCWAIVAIMTGAAVFRKSPRRMATRNIIWSIAVFAVMWAAFSFAAWLIHEQFNSVREMILIAFSFAAVGGLSVLISLNFASRADAKSEGVFSALTGMLAGAVFYLAGIFLAIYYIYVHYLIVVKL
jgi:TolA-binding protein